MKRLFFVFFGALLCIAPMRAQAQTAGTITVFSDVPVSHANADAVAYVYQQGIIQGYQDGSYKPGLTINRAEFTKIIMGIQYGTADADRCQREAKVNPFPDVKKDEWFAPYVCLAKQKGVIKGYPDGTFAPGKNITFAEAAKIITNAFDYRILTQDSVWYKPFVFELEKRNAIPLTVDAFTHLLTRGEMAEIVYRLKKGVDKPSHTYDSLAGTESVPKSSVTASYTGGILTGASTRSPVIDFNTTDYEKALASDKLIVLYFYASWCPVCQEEVPKFYAVMDQLNNPNVIGFRVNYKDDDTEEAEIILAREHGIGYQHTKVFVKDKERIYKSPESWDKDRYLQEINNYL